ncbi:MAG TPA: hypothetical protein VMM84_19765 [Pyrinomonadaceae bacterium]|nr:hypothetical protein [Pyrinomonadaceae bacterium]
MHRELSDLHLNVCSNCQEDVRSFLAFREQMAPELDLSYAPVMPELPRERLSWRSWWLAFAWKPAYSAALVVIGIALVIGVTLFLNRRSEDFHTAQTPLLQVSPATAENAQQLLGRAQVPPLGRRNHEKQ